MKNKWVAFLLCLFLGYLGIHKFYEGRILLGVVYLFTGGPAVALSWWISGIPFDLLHCGGNFVMVLVLFKPLRRLLTTLYTRLHA